MGRQLFYDQSITLYDTVDRDTATRSVLDMSPTSIGSLPLAKDQFDQSTISGLLNGGIYELTSNASGSSTFDVRGSSYIRFDADTKGTYAPEIGADGTWDFVEANTNTGVAIYDVVTVLGPPEANGQTGLFQFHWSASNNKLELQQAAIEELIGDTPLGPVTRLLNGFQSELTYEAYFDINVDGQAIAPQPYALTGLELADAPMVGEALPVETTRDFVDQELVFTTPITIGTPFVVDALLTLDLTLAMEVIGEGQPEFEALLNFENTIDSVSFSVVDDMGNEIPGVTISSTLGMDYGGASRATSVPEPSTLALGLLAVVGYASRRRSR
ncbi:MAG: PEP-CTERM sorting domain-containing protein [Planctomycetota bacterium]